MTHRTTHFNLRQHHPVCHGGPMRTSPRLLPAPSPETVRRRTTLRLVHPARPGGVAPHSQAPQEPPRRPRPPHLLEGPRRHWHRQRRHSAHRNDERAPREAGVAVRGRAGLHSSGGVHRTADAGHLGHRRRHSQPQDLAVHAGPRHRARERGPRPHRRRRFLRCLPARLWRGRVQGHRLGRRPCVVRSHSQPVGGERRPARHRRRRGPRRIPARRRLALGALRV